jgi:predicted DNA-binding protein
MLTVTFEPEIEERIHSIARRTGRTDMDCVREALLAYIEELDDAEVAANRLAEPARLYSAAEVRRELDL